MTGTGFIIGINLVFFLAFGSLYIQLPGLIGDNGIAPIKSLDLSTPSDLPDFIIGIPSLIRFHNILKIDEYHMTELLVAIGFLLSFFSLVFRSLRGPLTILIQWISFVSVVMVCPGVTDWKWTSLLIEAGFLCFLMSIRFRNKSSSPAVIAWLLKWLVFRESVSTGYTLLVRSDLSWYSLSAMENFFSTQIAPTPLAYLYGSLPASVHPVLTAIVITIKLFVPFLFFVPVRGVQLMALVLEFLYQFNGLIFGNYGVHNILIIVLCLGMINPQPKSRNSRSGAIQVASSFLSLITLAAFFYGVWVFFGRPDNISQLRIAVPRNEIVAMAKLVVFYTIPVASGLFALTILGALLGALSQKGCMNKVLDFTGVVLVSLIGAGLFVASLSPFANLDDSGSVVALPKAVHEIGAALKPFHLANDYRYFNQKDRDAVLKVGKHRTILVIETANSEKGPWKELAFHHAPSDPAKMPSCIAGHWPILDYEAALSSERAFENSPLLAGLVYRILTNQKEAVDLLKSTGFDTAPKFVQIKKYSYKLTDVLQGPNWWTRKLLNIYLPPTQITTPRLTQIVTKLGVAGRRRQRPEDPNFISVALDRAREYIGQPPDLSIFYVALAVVFVANKLLLG